MKLRFHWIILAFAASGCSLVTVPVKTAGSIVTTTVKTTGNIVTAPFDAVGRAKDKQEPKSSPFPPQEKVRRADTPYMDPQVPTTAPSASRY